MNNEARHAHRDGEAEEGRGVFARIHFAFFGPTPVLRTPVPRLEISQHHAPRRGAGWDGRAGGRAPPSLTRTTYTYTIISAINAYRAPLGIHIGSRRVHAKPCGMPSHSCVLRVPKASETVSR